MDDRPLLVDARPIFHATAGGRGIGNYTLGLLQGLAEIGVPHVALVEPGDVESLSGSVDRERIAVWRRDVVRRLAEPRAWYVATGMFLHPIAFDPIPSVVTELGLPVAGVMYDVIPYRHPDRYFGTARAHRLAMLRAALARTVELTAAISQFSAATAIDELGLPAERVRVIGAGVEARFARPARRSRSRDVVAVTGPDPRKNTGGLLLGWAELPAPVRSRHRLVIVSGTGGTDQWTDMAAELGIDAGVDVIGAVDPARMVELLQRAALVVQPSLDEGFGLPVLEAAACGAIVICSNTSALPEVLDEPEATFDPSDPADMARAIERALLDPQHRRALAAAGRRAVRRWRWPDVATSLLAAIDEMAVAEPDRPVPIGERIGVVGSSEASVLCAALRSISDAEVVALVDEMGTDSVTVGGGAWPAAVLGRLVKAHDFDHLVMVLTGRKDEFAARAATREPGHVLLRAGVQPDPATLRLARSVIVEGSDVTGGVLDADDRPPVLVLPSAGAPIDQIAGDVLSWLRALPARRDTGTVAGTSATL